MRSLLLGLILVLAVAFPASAAQRVALVIGNSDYELISPLANPENDAALMAETLREVGFEVIEAKNADRRGMARAIRDFGKRLRGAGSDAVGLFYYAGHGVQAGGANYLIPLGAQVETEADLEIEAVSAGWVLGQMEYAGNGLNMVILDACRNNPFKGSFRSGGRGLARIETSASLRGTLIAYAAAPGEVARDGRGANSPYTAALAKAMGEPGLDLEDVFKRVRSSVESATGGAQVPWEESSLGEGDFYFVPPKATAMPATEPTPGAPAPTPGFDARAVELAFWNSIEKSIKTETFEAYLAQYPNGTFAALARLRIVDLKEMETAALTPPSQPAEEPAFAVGEMDETYYAMKRSNVRAGPGTEFDKVGRLSPGDEIAVTGKVKGGKWYRIETEGGGVGYVYAPLLKQTGYVDDIQERRNQEAIQLLTKLEYLPDASEDVRGNALVGAVQRFKQKEGLPGEPVIDEKLLAALRDAGEKETIRQMEVEIRERVKEEARRAAEEQQRAEEARRQAEHLRKLNTWGALAMNSRGAYGVVWDYYNGKDRAANDAVRNCNQKYGNCRLEVTFNNCLALAVTGKGGFGWSVRATLSEANRAAMSSCSSKNRNCYISVSECAAN